jgi:hypothetical protein
MGGAELGDGALELLGGAGDDGQVVSLLGEDAGDREPDAAGGAGDEGGPARGLPRGLRAVFVLPGGDGYTLTARTVSCMRRG